MSVDSDLPYESRIVWLRDPLQFTYLRESVIHSNRRRGKIRFPIGDLAFVVGYSEISPNRKPAWPYYGWDRRIWWLKTYDHDLDPDGVYKTGGPYEAVDPASIKAGQRSKGYQW